MSDAAAMMWTCTDCHKRNWQHCHWCPHCGALKPPPKPKPKPKTTKPVTVGNKT